MIRIAIVEDEPQYSRQLEGFVRDFSRESGLAMEVTTYSDGDELVERYRAQFDIILLDVEMPFLDGMTAAELIRRQDPEVVIIFITNMAQYAIRGYAVDAMDYVLKPVSYFAFSQRLARAIRRMKNRQRHFFTIPIKGGALKLDAGELYYLESQGHTLIFHTAGGDHTSTGSMSQWEEKLVPLGFFRCNKGYLVNLEHVDGFQDGCALVNGTQLVVSRPRKGAFLEALAGYAGGVSK